MSDDQAEILAGHRLRKSYRARGRGVVRAVDGVDFSVRVGETLGVVGESGSGKSTLARLALGLDRKDDGDLQFRGRDLYSLRRDRFREYRRAVQAVFQDPFSSLNPRMRTRDLVSEPVRVHQRLSRADLNMLVGSALHAVGLHPSDADRYPHEFSGGQRQRIAIARAIAVVPSAIVLDEPVSSLDVSIQGQIINLLQDLQDSRGVGYLFITHNLAVARHISHRIAVMYAGRVVEEGPAGEVFSDPVHPYTQALLRAVPSTDPSSRFEPTDEVPRRASRTVTGCSYYARCPLASSRCATEAPGLDPLGGRDRRVACFEAPRTGSVDVKPN